MQCFLRIKRDWKGRYEIYCNFIHLCGLLAPLFLDEFLYQFLQLNWLAVGNYPLEIG